MTRFELERMKKSRISHGQREFVLGLDAIEMVVCSQVPDPYDAHGRRGFTFCRHQVVARASLSIMTFWRPYFLTLGSPVAGAFFKKKTCNAFVYTSSFSCHVVEKSGSSKRKRDNISVMTVETPKSKKESNSYVQRAQNESHLVGRLATAKMILFSIILDRLHRSMCLALRLL